MKTIKFRCRHCFNKIEADEDMAGWRIECPHCERTTLVPMLGIHAGFRLAGFRINRRLGTGGMGEVWLAEQLMMERPVALKILTPALTQDQRFVDRFLQEAKIAARLNHPNIVPAYDAGVDKGLYYLATGYVEGESLDRRLLRDKRIPEKEALRIVRAIALALQYAWNQYQLLHRDLKPGNIMIARDGNVLLMDMGISKSLRDRSADKTQSDTFLGTPYYVSPELVRGEKSPDERSDIYSLGATLYHLVTGATPYDAETTMGILTRHLSDPLPDPRDAVPSLSKPCAALIEVMMAKDRRSRPADWEQTLLDIDRVLAGFFPLTKVAKDSAYSREQADHQDAGPKRLLQEPTPVRPRSLQARLQTFGIRAREWLSRPEAALVAGIVLLLAVGMLLSGGGDKTPSGPPPDRGAPGRNAGPVQESPAPEAPPLADEAARADNDEGDPEPEAAPAGPREEPEELWRFAASYGARVMQETGNYERAMANYRKVAQTLAGTRYEIMADVEIDRLRRARDAARDDILAELDQRTSALAQTGGFAEAVELLETYTGPLADDLQPVLADRREALLEQRQAWEQRKAEKREQVARQVAEHLFAGRVATALDHLRETPGAYGETNALDILRQVRDVESLLLDEFRALEGEQTDVVLGRKKYTFTITGVTNGTVLARREVTGGYVEHSFGPGDLSHAERRRRLSALHPSAKALWEGIWQAEQGRLENARDAFAYADPFSDRLLDTLDRRMMSEREALARRELDRLLARADLPPAEVLATNSVTAVLRETPVPDARLEATLEELEAYQTRFADTESLAEHQALIETVEEAGRTRLAPDFPDLLHGEVESFDPDTLAFSVRYRFENEEELLDWPVMRRLSSKIQTRRSLEKEGLEISASPPGGQMAVRFAPLLKRGKMLFAGEHGRQNFEAVLAATNGFVRAIAGARRGQDVLVLQRSRAGGNIPLLQEPFELSSGDPLSGSLARYGKTLAYSLNGHRWELQPDLPPGGFHFGLATLASRITVYEVLIEGVLDPAWYRRALEEANMADTSFPRMKRPRILKRDAPRRPAP